MFHKVHERFRTPHVATIITGVFVASFAAVASIDEMVDLTNIGTLFAFILVCAGIIILRRRQPDLKRPFRAPGGWAWALGFYVLMAAAVIFLPWAILPKALVLAGGLVFLVLVRNLLFPVLGMVSCLYLIYFLPPTSWLRFAAWLNIGFAIYATYGVKHSRLTGRTGDNEAAHDVYAAKSGAVLVLLGTGLLLAMRGLDLFLTAFKGLPPGSRRLEAAVAASLTGARWTEVSWFLLVPLAINAFVLCPVVAKRVLRHRRRTGGLTPGLLGSLALAIVLPVVSVLYFAKVMHP
jgi:hypothetical protein